MKGLAPYQSGTGVLLRMTEPRPNQRYLEDVHSPLKVINKELLAILYGISRRNIHLNKHILRILLQPSQTYHEALHSFSNHYVLVRDAWHGVSHPQYYISGDLSVGTSRKG